MHPDAPSGGVGFVTDRGLHGMAHDSGRDDDERLPHVEGLLTQAWSPGVIQDALQIIAEGVTEVVGFGVSSIGVLRGGDEIETVAVAGDPDAQAELINTFRPLASLQSDIALADDWGALCFVPHERVDLESRDLGWIPDLEPGQDPDAWHPLDLLFAPLEDAQGQLIGVLCVDLPEDGVRPGPERRRELTRYVVQCARAVDALLERERLSERVRLSDAARRVVRVANAQLTLEGILAECRGELVSAFGARGMWIQTTPEFGGRTAVHSADGTEVRLPDGLVRLAELSARRLWEQRRVVIVSQRRTTSVTLDAAQREKVLAFLDGLGLASVLFVPLGAGPECFGNLVLTRAASDPEWTDVEVEVALEIGHDLGRALLNARLYEREKRLHAELRALDRYKSQLVATVSHELKNPLTGILGHLELLEAARVEPEAERSLAAVERNANRMRSLVDDLLVLARAADPDRALRPVRVDLRDVADEAVELFAIQAKRKEVTVLVDRPDVPVPAAGDCGELDRVCANLLGNALKYSPPGSQVRISTAVADDTVRLVVADEGIGISPEDQEHLWTEFFRSADPAALRESGTGLGLAIVKRIVDRHGGRIEVSSARGAGSTFTLTLPRA
jgi:signal transduction histidine kinase